MAGGLGLPGLTLLSDPQDFERDEERSANGGSESDGEENIGWSTVNLDEEKQQQDVRGAGARRGPEAEEEESAVNGVEAAPRAPGPALAFLLEQGARFRARLSRSVMGSAELSVVVRCLAQRPVTGRTAVVCAGGEGGKRVRRARAAHLPTFSPCAAPQFSASSTTILDEEPIVNRGLAAALLLCQNKGEAL